MPKPPQSPAVPPPDDPGRRSAEWEDLGEGDPAQAARKRLKAIQSLKGPPKKPEEHADEQEKSSQDEPPQNSGPDK